MKPVNISCELQLPAPAELTDLLNAWLSALTHSSRPVRRLCLASLVSPSSAIDSPLESKDTSGLLNLSRLTLRALKAPAGGDSSAIPHLFTQLITHLLTGLTRDADKEIRLLYAQWLGAIGVIDPSRCVQRFLCILIVTFIDVVVSLQGLFSAPIVVGK